ncbi:GGDEF domain-containing protein [Rubrivivax sp. RP6-9]|uniref:GGDEF domain-containing protein n=1 Tax=Rubrivivax sp. RP6-9 TaxID=3415750 RepID=UPI003CC610D6
MSQVVEHLAELTGLRDRDVLDVTLVGALRDLLRPERVAVYRCVGDAGDRRWMTRAHLHAGDSTATADPLWAEPDTLPRLQAHPERQACLQQQQPVFVAAEAAVPARSLFPLVTDREVVGVVEFDTPEPMDADQVRLVTSILRVYRNFQGLLDYSERDTLTGLLNRKTFDEAFMRSASDHPPPGVAAAGARRAGTPQGSWLAVIDIDHFKAVNDTHGHLIGDEVLLLLSRLMRANFRFSDRLYRFGGEEFLVLMRCASAADAARALERLRANVQRYAFPRVGQITVSVGFTEVRPVDTPSSAFERADRAVYVAKGRGRNQVVSHAELVASGQLDDGARVGDMELF